MYLCMARLLLLLRGDSLALGLVGMWPGLWAGVLWAVSMMCICVYIHECVCVCVCGHPCPDYAGIIVGRWGKQSLKVRVVWLISSSLYHFN